MPGRASGIAFGMLSGLASRPLGFLPHIFPALFILSICARSPPALPLKAEVRRIRDSESIRVILNEWTLEKELCISWLTLPHGTEAVFSETAFPLPRSFSLSL